MEAAVWNSTARKRAQRRQRWFEREPTCRRAATPRCRAARTPSASARTRSATAGTVAAVGLASGPRLLRTASTSAEPTTTPSALSAIARACSAVRTPKPTQTGSLVWRLMRATAAATLPGSGAAAPVMPVIET